MNPVAIFFLVMIVLNLTAWVMARREVKRIRKDFLEAKGMFKTLYEELFKKQKTIKQYESESCQTSKKIRRI